MKVKKRIHIAPVGFEVDRIVIPAINYNADKVYLLVHNNKAEDKAGAYVKRIIDELKKQKIETEKVFANWRDVESITKEARKLFLELSGNDIYVNIASGSKNHAIALDRAIMTLDDQSNIKEFYAESGEYEGFKPGKQQLSKGVREVKEIPKRKMVLPNKRLLGALTIVRDYNVNERGCTRSCKKDHEHMKKKIKKKQLAELCIEQGILPAAGNNLTSLDKNIIQKLEKDWDFIEVEKIGQSYYVGLTPQGEAHVHEMTS
tara:strand:+ start:163 stop:942 length:780 start_codon:yes stop_codon:yes gene_type:complete